MLLMIKCEVNPQMPQQPFRQCRLCLQDRPLCNSHLLPKAMYRTLRSVLQAQNRNPLAFGYDFAYTTSNQTSDYLLCEECEGRFSRSGERWVLRHCYRRRGVFPLRTTLQQTVPAYADNDILIYAAAAIPELDTVAITYFGMSIFWRAAVHSWRLRDRRIGINLGPYAEPMRTFLLGESEFPDQTALSVLVGIEDRMIEWAMNPISHNEDGFHSHTFTIPGMTFMLNVGGRLPAEFIEASFAPSAQRLIAIFPEAERRQLTEIGRAYRSTATRLRR